MDPRKGRARDMETGKLLSLQANRGVDGSSSASIDDSTANNVCRTSKLAVFLYVCWKSMSGNGGWPHGAKNHHRWCVSFDEVLAPCVRRAVFGTRTLLFLGCFGQERIYC